MYTSQQLGTAVVEGSGQEEVIRGTRKGSRIRYKTVLCIIVTLRYYFLSSISSVNRKKSAVNDAAVNANNNRRHPRTMHFAYRCDNASSVRDNVLEIRTTL